MRYRQLTAPERRVWEAFHKGERVTLGRGEPVNGDAWGPERTIRAEVIRDLLLGPESPNRGGVPALRLDGARVVGALDLRFASVRHALSLRSCRFEAVLDLHGLRCREIDLRGSHLREGIYASTAEIDGHLILTEATVERTVRLIATHVGGALFMDGTRLRAVGGRRPGPVFEADRLRVHADMLCRDGFHADGEMRFPGARIGDSLDFTDAVMTNENACAVRAPRITVGGDLVGAFFTSGEVDLDGATIEGRLSLDRARMDNAGGYALRAARLTVLGEMRCGTGFTAAGELHLLNARISGPLILDGARIDNAGRIALHASGLSADSLYCRDGFTLAGEMLLSGARITGPMDLSTARLTDGSRLSLGCWWLTSRELILRLAAPPTGVVDLRYARLGLLQYTPETLPTELRIDGLTYNSIAPAREVATGLAWLERTPPGFRPQPYEQLAETYRRNGNDSHARHVLLAKERRRRSTLSPVAKAWGYLQDATVGYGYRPWRAACWLFVLLVAGSTAFHHSRPVSIVAHGAPPFNSIVYTIDLLLPIVDLGQRKAYLPQAGWAQWLAYGLVAVGWILVTTIAAGITRALRRQ